jgi:hypothetical protein
VTLLSTRAIATLAERHVRKADAPVPIDEVLVGLQRFGVEPDRAEAGVQRAIANDHLESVLDADERPCVRLRATADAAGSTTC